MSRPSDRPIPLRTDPRTLVLAALSAGPCHGYALAKAIQGVLGDHHRVANAQVYAALKGLESRAWIVGERDAAGAERRVYRLTEPGHLELGWRTAEWHDCAEAIARLLPRRANAPVA